MPLANYIKQKIQDKIDIGLAPADIFIAAIHTHSAPDLTGEYHWPGGIPQYVYSLIFYGSVNDKFNVWIAYQIVKLVKRLVNELQPAKMAWVKKRIEKDIVINRRHPSRRSKQDLGVIIFRHLETDKIIGIMANFGTHPTTLSRWNDKISADYPGRVNYKIEQLTGNDEGAIFFTGAAGDMNPITTCGTDFDKLENDPKARNTVMEQHGTYKSTERIGFYLGTEAVKLAEAIPLEDYYTSLDIKSYTRSYWVPMQDKEPYIYKPMIWLGNRALFLAKKWIAIPLVITVAGKDPNFPGFALKHYPFSFRRGWHINIYSLLQYLDITASNENGSKKLSIFGFPGEVFEDTQKKVMQNSPVGAENTFLFQEANDYITYLFSIKEYITLEGYESAASITPLAGEYTEKEWFRFMEEIRLGMINYS